VFTITSAHLNPSAAYTTLGSRTIRTDIAVLYVGDEAEKQALLLGEPDLFFTAPGYGGSPLVMLRLEAVDAGKLRELVTDAWRMRGGEELPGP